MDINTVKDLKKALRIGPHAWPGGYPLYFITSDGAALSFKAVRQEIRQVMYSIKHKMNDGWRVIGMDINYEDSELFCEHTGEQIECAYDNN